MSVPKQRAPFARYAAIFASGTLASRVLGMVRDITWVLIPDVSRDAFIVAFRFPNMLRDLVGEGASNAAFVPVFSDTLEQKDDAAFRELVSSAMSAMLLLLGGLTVAGLLLVPALLQQLDFFNLFTNTEERSGDYVNLITNLAIWTFPYLFFIGMTVYCMGPLFALNRYFAPSWSPVLLNIAFIVAVLLFHNSFAEPAFALVLGMWLGGAAQLVMQYIALGRHTGVWLPNFHLGHPGVRTIFLLLIPVLFGQAAGEVNKVVDTMFAATLQAGTVSQLFYANRLVQLPLAVFAMATSVAILPSMSRAASRKDFRELKSNLMQGLRQSYFLLLPATLGLIILGEPIVRLLFERANFTPEDTTRTARALALYSIGLLGFGWVKVLVTGFYAEKNTRTPVVIAAVCMVLNILLNFVLVGYWQYLGLATATTISFSLNALLLYLFLSVRHGWLWNAEFASALLRMTTATLMMSAVAYAVYYVARNAFDDTLLDRLLIAGLPIIAAVIAYFSLAAIMGLPEVKRFWGVFGGIRLR